MALFEKKERTEAAIHHGSQSELEQNLKSILDGSYQPKDGAVLLFIGNGANGYDKTAAYNLLRLKNRGKFTHMAGCIVRKGSSAYARNVFTHPKGTFAGYTCRKKVDGVWRWFTTGNAWRKADASVKRRYFQDGENLEDLEIKPGEVLLFDAAWITADGKYLDYGYEVFQYRLMARSLGGYWGKTKMNTKMALYNSIQNNFHFFGVDLKLTEDDFPVCSNGWDPKTCEALGLEYQPEFAHMTREMFRELKIDGQSTVDAEKIYRRMQEHPDFFMSLRLCCDTAEQNEQMLRRLVTVFQDDVDVLDRCVIELTAAEQYDIYRKVYPFRYWIYVMEDEYDQVEQVLQFCVDRGISAIAMNEFIAEPKRVQKIRCAGVHVAAHTVDGKNAALRLLHSGVNTVFTNFLSPMSLDEPQKGVQVIYNSGPDAQEHISELLERGLLASNSFLQKTKKGSWEYTVLGAVGEHTPYRLMSNCYTKEGYVFQGWNVRTLNKENKGVWLTSSGEWRGKAAIEKSDRLNFMLIEDRAKVPMATFPEKNRLWFMAKWISEEELEAEREKKKQKK